MADISKLIESLSPEKRKLLELQLKKQSGAANAFPLSFAQQRLWFLAQLEPESAAYNIPAAVRLKGELDQSVLEKSLAEIINRHEVFRTTFTTIDGNPMQVLSTNGKLNIDKIDLSATVTPENNLIEQIQDRCAAPFNLTTGPLLKATIFRLAPQEYVLLLIMHHIIADGWSIGVFVSEFVALYRSFSTGKHSPLPPLKIQYADYARWQRQHLRGENRQKQLEFWKQQLSGHLPVLELPTDYPRQAVKSYRGANTTHRTSPELLDQTRKLSAQQGATMFMTLLAVFDVLLYRYSRQDDICIGTPIANRNRAETEGLIGFFVNTLIMRCNLSGEPTFTELLQRVRQTALNAFTHQDLPFETLVEELHPERSMSHTPLFQVMFVHQTGAIGDVSIPGLSVTSFPIKNESAKFDLTFTAAETPDGLLLAFEYDTDLFSEASVRRMLEQYEVLLKGALTHHQQSISELPIHSEHELQLLLRAWQPCPIDYPSQKCIHQLFEEQAAVRHEAIAIDFLDEILTYRELNAQANQLAHYLIEQGVCPEDVVGILLERSPQIIVSILAIWKSGAAYLPLDPSYPQDRLSFMLNDSKASLVLTTTNLAVQVEANQHCIYLDSQWGYIAAESPHNINLPLKGENLAYVIYTSGSTGQPKGVMIEHRSALHLMQNLTETVYNRFDGKSLRISMNAPIMFDASVQQIVMLAKGHTLCIIPQEVRGDGVGLLNYIQQHQIEVLDCVPSQLKLLAEAELFTSPGFKPKAILPGGEAIDELMWKQLVEAQDIEFFNMYGPTECTVDSTIYRVKDYPQRPVIGKPVANASFFVLDQQAQLTPIGVPGELYISGAGLARGYLNRQELTAEKFIPNSFSVECGMPNAEFEIPNSELRLYKTGDLVRWLSDGVVEFLGRVDFQVKVRGFRIELGEIESALRRHELIKDTVVTAQSTQYGDKWLVAYLLAENEQTPSISELRTFLKKDLPDYMIPAVFMFLPAFPLTPNGKVDHHALPAPDEQRFASQQEYIAPRTPTEEMVANIFGQLLNVHQVGVTASFFDLGGHSLLATQLLSRLRDAFKVDLQLRVLFESPTVELLARCVDKATLTSTGLPAIELKAISRDQDLPLSFAQQRLWFLDQLQPDDASYNIPSAYRIKGELELDILHCCIDELIKRHESLRTTVQTTTGIPQQVIAPQGSLELPIIDLTKVVDSELNEEIYRLIFEEARKPFNLSEGPLTRITLLRLSEKEHVILLTMHHIVSDGWSLGILIQEIAKLYQAFKNGETNPLSPLPLQYADFAHWQRNWLTGDTLDIQLDYWRKQLGHGSPILELPLDHRRPDVPSSNGKHRPFQLKPELTQKLHELSRKQNTTLFMTLLASFQTFLHYYSGQTDISVGTPIANRNRSDIEGIIGFFVNTLVMRCDLSDDPRFTDVLKQVRETALGAFTHQDIPFDRLVDALQPERHLNHTPLFQVMFVLQNIPYKFIELPSLSMENLEVENDLSHFDLTLTMFEQSGRLSGAFEYKSDIFEIETIDRFIENFTNLLEQVVANPLLRLSQIDIIPAHERNLQLTEWNRKKLDFSKESCMHSQFERQVLRRPNAVAAVFEEQTITYSALNIRANQLSHYLRKNGIGRDVLVGVYMDRSIDVLIAMLAILKAGGAYLPIDPIYPIERVAFMLEDSEAPMVLTQQSLKEKLPPTHIKIICLDTDHELFDQESVESPQIEVQPDNLIYVIYTSGSTGKPKGTLITHYNVVRLFQATQEWYQFNDKDIWTFFHSFAFDFSVWEIWGTLIYGGKLIIVPFMISRSPEAFYELLVREKVTVLNQTPSAFRQLIQAEEMLKVEQSQLSLRYVIFGGEELKLNSLKPWFDRHGDQFPKLINMYGITETTVHVTYRPLTMKDMQDNRGSVIGEAIPDLQVFILNQNLQPMPIGAPGEIHVGGNGLARGYLKRPELSSTKFVANPFSDKLNERLYRTGDLGRFLPNGDIEYLGRSDSQVKIRGFRIELGEIENVLSMHPQIREALVIPRKNNVNEDMLVGYLIAQTDQSPDLSALRSYLRKQLPEYMTPAAFVVLDTFPLTPNGKIDRRALPEPDENRLITQREYIAPRTEKEKILADIWQQVLGLKQVGIDDNFFELGGDSILSIQVIARARLAGIKISAVQLFQHQNIAGIAASAVQTEAIQAEQGAVSGEAALTPIQKWFFEQNIVERQHWNQSIILQVKEHLNIQYLEQTALVLQEQHDALRVRFEQHDTIWRQFYEEKSDKNPFVYFDFQELESASEKEVIEKEAAKLQARLNLQSGPIWRLAYFDLGVNRPGRLLTIIHHLAVDGVSWRILLEDIQSIYQQLAAHKALQLPQKTTSFKYWAEQLIQYAQADEVRKQIDFWVEQTEKQSATLPLDFPQGINDEQSFGVVSESLTQQETAYLLQEIPVVYKTQINEALLTPLVRAFGRWIGKHKLLIDLEGHGREEIIPGIDISRTVGWFTTIFPILLDVTGMVTPGDALKAIKEQLRHIPSKGIGFGLLRYLNNDDEIPRRLQALPAAQISFNYLGQIDQALPEQSPFLPARESSGGDRAVNCLRKYILEISGTVAGSVLTLKIAFSKNQFRLSTMEKLVSYYASELRDLINFCKNPQAGGYTPSDFKMAKLDQAKLDKVLGKLGKKK